jgi:hypothetical protein
MGQYGIDVDADAATLELGMTKGAASLITSILAGDLETFRYVPGCVAIDTLADNETMSLSWKIASLFNPCDRAAGMVRPSSKNIIVPSCTSSK